MFRKQIRGSKIVIIEEYQDIASGCGDTVISGGRGPEFS